MKKRIAHLIYSSCGTLVVVLCLSTTGCDSSASNDEAQGGLEEAGLAACPMFAPAYSSCEKIDGILPQFFQTVEIETHTRGYLFTTVTDQGPLETQYIPDRVVRLGSDYHALADGTQLPNLPALESSYCEDEILFRNEVTILPDQELAQEEIMMSIGDEGELLFQIVVNGELLLEAQCFE